MRLFLLISQFVHEAYNTDQSTFLILGTKYSRRVIERDNKVILVTTAATNIPPSSQQTSLPHPCARRDC